MLRHSRRANDQDYTQSSICTSAHYERAEEFLNALLPSGEHFINDGLSERVFRGHCNAQRHQLVPAALRDGGASLEPYALGRCDCSNNRGQISAEFDVFRRFFRLADEVGLPLPEDSQQLREMASSEQAMIDWDRIEHEGWPPQNLLAIFGLIQHHGLPTRLLDWTANALVAAYFAARIAAEDTRCGTAEKGQRLSVWSLSIERMQRIRQRARKSAAGLLPFQTISVPSAGNPNLRAQAGLFTLYRPDSLQPDEPVDRRPLDAMVEEQLAADPDAGLRELSSGLFTNFTAPVSEAPRLLWLLAKYGVRGAQLFPGYDGVAKGVQEELLFDRPDAES